MANAVGGPNGVYTNFHAGFKLGLSAQQGVKASAVPSSVDDTVDFLTTAPNGKTIRDFDGDSTSLNVGPKTTPISLLMDELMLRLATVHKEREETLKQFKSEIIDQSPSLGERFAEVDFTEELTECNQTGPLIMKKRVWKNLEQNDKIKIIWEIYVPSAYCSVTRTPRIFFLTPKEALTLLQNAFPEKPMGSTWNNLQVAVTRWVRNAIDYPEKDLLDLLDHVFGVSGIPVDCKWIRKAKSAVVKFYYAKLDSILDTYTPLHYAVTCLGDRVELVKLLLKYGADPRITDGGSEKVPNSYVALPPYRAPKNALELAREAGNVKVAKLLETHIAKLEAEEHPATKEGDKKSAAAAAQLAPAANGAAAAAVQVKTAVPLPSASPNGEVAAAVTASANPVQPQALPHTPLIATNHSNPAFLTESEGEKNMTVVGLPPGLLSAHTAASAAKPVPNASPLAVTGVAAAASAPANSSYLGGLLQSMTDNVTGLLHSFTEPTN